MKSAANGIPTKFVFSNLGGSVQMTLIMEKKSSVLQPFKIPPSGIQLKAISNINLSSLFYCIYLFISIT